MGSSLGLGATGTAAEALSRRWCFLTLSLVAIVGLVGVLVVSDSAP